MNYDNDNRGATARTKRAPLMTAGELFSKVLDSEAAHTSFGKLMLGDERSAPLYCIVVSIIILAFGHGNRFNTNLFYFSKEMAAAQNSCRWSPAPNYNVNGDVKYPYGPKYSFGKSQKNPLDIKPFCYEEAITVQTPVIFRMIPSQLIMQERKPAKHQSSEFHKEYYINID